MYENMKIESTILGYEEHGILTCILNLTKENISQSFGYFTLDEYKNGKRNPTIFSGFWIQRILEVVGVLKWENLKGKYVRVHFDNYENIIGIGHIIKDKWFYPKKEMGKLYNEQK